MYSLPDFLRGEMEKGIWTPNIVRTRWDKYKEDKN